MTEYKTLRVPVEAWKEAKEQKEAADRTWGEQIVRPEGTPEDTPDKMLRINDFPTADVKEAVRDVLREELPEGALR